MMRGKELYEYSHEQNYLYIGKKKKHANNFSFSKKLVCWILSQSHITRDSHWFLEMQNLNLPTTKLVSWRMILYQRLITCGICVFEHEIEETIFRVNSVRTCLLYTTWIPNHLKALIILSNECNIRNQIFQIKYVPDDLKDEPARSWGMSKMVYCLRHLRALFWVSRRTVPDFIAVHVKKKHVLGGGGWVDDLEISTTEFGPAHSVNGSRTLALVDWTDGTKVIFRNPTHRSSNSHLNTRPCCDRP